MLHWIILVKIIEFLANNNLLALFASIKYIDDANENYEQILGILTEWSNEKHESYSSFQEEVVKTLYTYDSELVVTLLGNIILFLLVFLVLEMDQQYMV